MSFKADVNNIRKAIKGKDVKESIASAIENAYAESINKGNTDAEVVQARGTKDTLNERITQIETDMGKLEGVNVNDKTSFVSAINEVIANINRDDIFPWLRWITCADMPKAIEMFGIGVIDNSILLWQGRDSSNGHSNKVYRYNIETNIWKDITSSGTWTPIIGNVSQSSSISFKYNGEDYILSIGGYDGSTYKRKSEIIRVEKDKATIIGYLNYARQNASLSYYNGKVYIIGGYNNSELGYTSSGYYTNAVECFDIATKQATILEPLPIAMQGYVTSAVKDGKIYIFESSIDSNTNNYIYDIATNTYTTFEKSSLQTTDALRATLYDNYIILMGGYNNTVIWYDIANNKYIDKTDINGKVKAWSTPVMDKYDHLYLFGGATKDSSGTKTIHADVDCYLPIRDLEDIQSNIENTSIISATSIAVGETVTMTAIASGGSGSYLYSYYYSAVGGDWIAIAKNSSESTMTYSFKEVGSYVMIIKVIDEKGHAKSKRLPITVTE